MKRVIKNMNFNYNVTYTLNSSKPMRLIFLIRCSIAIKSMKLHKKYAQ